MDLTHKALASVSGYTCVMNGEAGEGGRPCLGTPAASNWDTSYSYNTMLPRCIKGIRTLFKGRTKPV